MSENIDSRAVSVSVKIYERLLAAYPGAFRREYGPAMEQLFRDQCRDAWSESGGWGLAGVWLRVLPDCAKTSFVEHLSNLHRRESLFMKAVRAIRDGPRLRSAFVRVFGAGFVFATVCAALLALWSPRVYSSRVTIETHNDTKASPSDPSAAQHTGDADPYFLTTQSKIIESYHILTNVIVELNLGQKLAEQLGKPRWTMDETYLRLSKMIHVEKTRMTSLLEITVNNPNPALAATIANSIAESYRNVRVDQWKEIHLGGIYAYETNLAAMGQLLKEKQEELDRLRAELGATGIDTQLSNSAAAYGKMLQVWAEEKVMMKADFLEYSNILFRIAQIPRDELEAQLPRLFPQFGRLPGLPEKSINLSHAKEAMIAAAAKYDFDSPKYKAAARQLESAQQEYDDKVEEIPTSLRFRVSEEVKYLQIIEQTEKALRAYHQLTDEVENLRYKNRESERWLNQSDP